MGQIILLIILIFINGFFAAAEISFISLNDNKIKIEAKEGNKKAKKIEKMLENPSKFLSTIQIGITLAGFLSSAFAANNFAAALATKLNIIFPSISLITLENISIVLITILLSLVTLIFGELVPKRIGMKYSEKIAYGSVGIIRAIAVVTYPIVKMLTGITNFISGLFGISDKDEEVITEEEIRMMVDVGEEKGTIEEDESQMINNVFDLDDKIAQDVMVPRTEMYAADMNLSISELIEDISDNFHYSRIPVYDKSIDKIEGIIFIKDILIYEKNYNSKIKNLMKEPHFVPTNMPVKDLFDMMKKERLSIVIVVDQYGGTAGVITIEDILEEIVGDIYDEYDIVKKVSQQIDENTYIFNGSISMMTVENIFDIELEDESDEHNTLSGYLINKLGRIPEEDEKLKVKTDRVNYYIEKVADNKIVRVKGKKIKKREVKEKKD